MSMNNERTVPRVVPATLTFFVAMAGLAACNTTAGLGQDVKNTGQTITNTADANKPN